MKAAGFKWAPKQELFVAPAWSPRREDLCIELAGEIEPEGTTLAERAEAKAARLDELAEKRRRDADAFCKAADSISERFAFGQPILAGHHSERKARKDADRMDNYMRKSVKARDAIDYWLWRASGVEYHANHKSRPDVRARRIKTLLADLRREQRVINDAHKKLEFWRKISAKAPDCKTVHEIAGRVPLELSGATEDWCKLGRGEITGAKYIANRIDNAERVINGPNRRRVIAHILNRLAYERAELGSVPRYSGELSAVILQTFAREQGADKPKAEKTNYGWLLSSPVPLPAHLADSCEIELEPDAWRDLMESAGYAVPKKKAAKPPILNIRAETMAYKNPYSRDEAVTLPQVEITKEQYSKIPNDYRGVKLSICGQYRFRVAIDRYLSGGQGHNYVAVFITDQKAHEIPAAPESEAVA